MKPFLSSVNVCHRILDCYFWVFAIELCQQPVMPKQIYGRLNNMSLCLTVSMVNFRPLSVFYLSITAFSTDSVAFFQLRPQSELKHREPPTQRFTVKGSHSAFHSLMYNVRTNVESFVAKGDRYLKAPQLCYKTVTA